MTGGHATALGLVVVLSLTGCGLYTAARVTVNDPISQADIAFIEPGKTTLLDVVDHLGAPDEMTGVEHGAVIVYHFRDAKYSRVNLFWPLRFWLPVQPDMILSGGGLGSDRFEVAFDRAWIVQHQAFARQAQGVRHRLWPF